MCLSSGPEQRQAIKIWRDTGALQSVVLCDVFPFNDTSPQGSDVLVKGFGEEFLSMASDKIDFQSYLVSGMLLLHFVPRFL